jgi:hypothetical protein
MRFYPLIFAWLILSCQRVPYQIQSHYNENTNLVKPNYALKEYWAHYQTKMTLPTKYP